MIQKIKKPVSILLAVLMVVSLFVAVPFTAGAATAEEPVGDDTCYLAGTMTSWSSEIEAYRFSPSTDKPGEYVLLNVSLTTSSEFKVVYNGNWLPGNPNENYGANGEITEDGVYDIYFNPNGQGEGYYAGYIKAELHNTHNGVTEGLIKRFTFENEDELDEMTFIDSADGAKWIWSDYNGGGYDYTGAAYQGKHFIMTYSYVDYVGSYQADNWMITPAIELPEYASKMSFYVINANADYPEDFDVCIGTSNDPADMTVIQTVTSNHNGFYEPWDYVEIDLTAYAGQTIYVGFHDTCYDMYEAWVDLIEFRYDANTPIHTVTWKNDNGEVLATDKVKDGTTPTYGGAVPTKDADNYYTYTFSGWSDGETTYAPDQLPAVSGNVTYTATFTPNLKSYTITWVDDNDEVIDTTTVAYGDTPTHADATKTSTTDGVRYVFTGWDPEVVSVTGAATYKATFKTQYKITWDKANGETNDTTWVDAGTVPTHADPTKAADAQYIYNFKEWSPAPVAATAPATYTATFTAVPKSLIPRKSLTLDGNIIVNFFIDPSAAGLTPEMVEAESKTLTVTIDWADYRPLSKIAKTVTITVNGTNFKEIGDLIPVSCEVCAAEMSCDIKVDVELNGESDGITYSVRDYGKTILDRNSKYAADEYASLRKLVVAMLDYGAKAQEVFGIKTTDPANGFFGDEGYKINLADYGITYDKDKDEFDEMFVEAIEKANGGETGDDISAVAANHGAKWYTTSVYFLNNNKIRHVFTKANDTFNPELFPKENNQHNFYYWVESKGIPAAELDTLQTFKVGDTEFYYSVLDYARALSKSEKNSDAQKLLARAVYWYNQAANAYFDEPAPAGNTVDLSTLTTAYEAQDGDVLTGELKGDYQITIAAGATITLKDVTITCLSEDAEFAGITPLGDATILLEGTNVVKGGFVNYGGGYIYANFPGIFAPAGYTLTIDGEGSLTASKGDDNNGIACGIGGGAGINAGNIEIKGGNITATGGIYAAGIGGGLEKSCGNIVINGGNITATGGSYAAGIGGGNYGSCGNITIADTVTSVTATKGSDAPNSIGAGYSGSCGTVTIGGTVYQNGITTSPYTYEPN